MHRGSSRITPSVASATQGYFSSPNGLRIPGRPSNALAAPSVQVYAESQLWPFEDAPSTLFGK
jgi:hypothetical protein